MRLPRRRVSLAALLGCLLLLAVPVLSGCGFRGVSSLPLPGGADLGDHPYVVKAEFSDVLNLVPQSSVKVNEVAVGKITKIELEPDNTTALVTMRINGDVRLAGNATAAVRQASLLGAKYVEMSNPPAGHASGTMKPGGTIPLERTETTATVEDVLGALSLLLNGGGVQRIGTITSELNKALVGHEPQIRSMLSRVDTLVSDLDGQRKNIVRAIDGMHRLSGILDDQKGKIADALDELNPGIEVLNRQRKRLVTMLKSLDKLSGVAVDTVRRSKHDLVSNLKSLEPTLRKLAEAGESLPKSMQLLLTYPFGQYAMNDLRGDFFNAEVHLNFDLAKVLDTAGRSKQPILGLGNGGNIGPLPDGSDSGSGDGRSTSDSPSTGSAIDALPIPDLGDVPAESPGSGGDGLGGVLGQLLGGE